jgi:hypothetical protein
MNGGATTLVARGLNSPANRPSWRYLLSKGDKMSGLLSSFERKDARTVMAELRADDRDGSCSVTMTSQSSRARPKRSEMSST